MSATPWSYLNNSNLRRANYKMRYTAQQIEEIRKCADPVTGWEYFIRHYYKIVNVDHGLMLFKPFGFQIKMAKGFHENRFSVCRVGRQMGKALGLKTPIPTPTGWTTMGELKVGDVILSRDGTPTTVIFVTETMYDHDCYDVTFDNEEVVTADADHLWTIRWGDGERTLTTKELVLLNEYTEECVSGGIRLAIRTAKPVELPEIDLPIDPYILGVWLGDGYSAGPNLIASIEDFTHYQNEFDKRGYNLIEKRYNSTKTCIVGKIEPKDGRKFTHILRDLDLRDNKHIPNLYLRASKEQRLDPIRGLMDTDGYVDANGRCEFDQKKVDLANQTKELLCSLGVKVRHVVKVVNGEDYQKLRFATLEPICSLPRKVERLRKCYGHTKNTHHFIKKIEKVDSVPVRCIQVDNPDHLFLCSKAFIPTHNSSICVAYLLWVAMFNPFKGLAILANKADTAKELLHRIKTAVEHLPIWLQQGVERWDQTKIAFENGSSILASATSGSAVRGGSFYLVFLDEYAFVPSNEADNFFKSVYPTISSGESSKMIVVSTPQGMNHFYEMWRKAVKGKSQFKPIDIHWSEHPRRDKAWAEAELSNMTAEQFDQEYNCNFLSGAGALISSVKLQRVADEFVQEPIQTLPVGRVKTDDDPDPINFLIDNSLRIYERPIEGHRYVIVCDPAEGIGQDYTAFVVFDVTELPHRQVATYHSKNISPLALPNELVTMAKSYNSAYILIETLQVGFQVAYALWFEHDYPYVFTYFRDKNRNKLKVGYRRGYFGVRTNTQVKSSGCGNLKGLVENDQLIIRDEKVVQELSTFTFDGTQYKAEEGNYDDLCMCFVLFAWLIKQDEFQTLTGTMAGKKVETVIEPSPPLMPIDPLFGDENEYLVWETVKSNTSSSFFDDLTSDSDFNDPFSQGSLVSNRS